MAMVLNSRGHRHDYSQNVPIRETKCLSVFGYFVLKAF